MAQNEIDTLLNKELRFGRLNGSSNYQMNWPILFLNTVKLFS